MSSPDIERVRNRLVEVAKVHPGGYVGIAKDAKLGATDEAVRLFAEGVTGVPRFLGLLSAWLNVWTAPTGALVDAERALRSIQDAYEAQGRVVALLKAGLSADDAQSISAADKPIATPSEQQDAPRATRRGRGAAR